MPLHLAHLEAARQLEFAARRLVRQAALCRGRLLCRRSPGFWRGDPHQECQRLVCGAVAWMHGCARGGGQRRPRGDLESESEFNGALQRRRRRCDERRGPHQGPRGHARRGRRHRSFGDDHIGGPFGGVVWCWVQRVGHARRAVRDHCRGDGLRASHLGHRL